MTLAQLVETDTSPGKQEYRRVTWRGAARRERERATRKKQAHREAGGGRLGVAVSWRVR